MGPGENAGAIDVGDGLAVVFKVESHNHPSAVEPFQGAATGVGGILRDVFALGARPVAVLDSLRFGDPDTPRTRYLLERVVAGIAAYGNSVGVATVGGEIYFEPPYEQNCLVNAMCVGLAPADRLVRSAAAGPGNLLVLLGARTGRDGIGGASVLASAELDEADQAKRPSVQIGDPLEESKLIECCLELVDAELLVALQDLGAAGLSSSTSEMAVEGRRRPRPRRREGAAARARHGAVRDHDLRVPGADAVRGRAGAARRRAGRLPRAGRRARRRSATVTDTGAPARLRRRASWSATCRSRRWSTSARSTTSSRRSPRTGWRSSRRRAAARCRDADAGRRRCARCSARANVASRRWVFEQYDFLVGSRTVRRPEQADAAVLRLAHDGVDTGRALAVSIDGNGRRVACDPYIGAAEAVCECAANLACVGAEPLGLTNCLNFGNPEKPHVAWQLTRAVEGMAAACRAFGVPVVGGNVSLYNEGPEGPIYPTPVVGMVGELPDAARARRRPAFAPPARRRADLVALVGPFRPSLLGSELAEAARRAVAGGCRRSTCGRCVEALELVREAVRAGGVCKRARRLRRRPRRCRRRVRAARWRRRASSTSSRLRAARRSTPSGAVRRGPGRDRRLRAARGADGAEQQGARSRLPGARHGGRTRRRDRGRRC